MSRASFVSERSVAWLTPSVCQTRHSYHRVQTCATHARISVCLLCVLLTQSKCNVSYWHKGFWVQQHNVLAYLQVQAAFCHCDRVPSSTKVLGATEQRTCLPTGSSGFTIVIVSPAAHRAVRHHQVQEALTPTYWGCVQQRHNWVLTPTYFIVFNDNTVHTISATVTLKCSFSNVSWSSYVFTVQVSAAQYLL